MGWVGVQQVGWLRRQQQRRPTLRWANETDTAVVSQARSQAAAAVVPRQLRGHWGENRLHWVRDVVAREDHNLARATGHVLDSLRNTAISRFRLHEHSGI